MSASHSFDQYILTPPFLANPYPFYHQLRAEAPVYWSERLQAWILTRYTEVMTALHDPRLNSGERITAILSQLPETVRVEMQPLAEHMTQWVAFTDPPDHTRLRTLVGKAFTPRTIEKLRPQVQVLVDELLDVVQEAGHMDVIRDFAFPLPATVIAQMLGIPREDHDRFRQWSNDIAYFISAGGINIEVARKAQQSVLELADYFQGIVAQRRHRPQDDLISALVAVEEQGDKLSETELFSMFVQLFFAGHETTMGLIGNGLLALLRHPDQRHKLQDQPSLIASAVEEFLRYDTSIQRQARVASEDIEIDGHLIRKGQYILLFIAAANRDPAQFPEPDRLDITRQENRHLSFGYGIHFCIGAPLARLEAQIALDTLLRRMPKLQLAGETLAWEPLLALRKLKALPVTF